MYSFFLFIIFVAIIIPACWSCFSIGKSEGKREREALELRVVHTTFPVERFDLEERINDYWTPMRSEITYIEKDHRDYTMLYITAPRSR